MTVKERVFGLIRYSIVNGIFAYCVYAGFYLGIEGPQNIAKFMIWLMFLVALMMCIPQVVEIFVKSEKPIERSMPKEIDWVYDAVVVVALIYLGAFLYGSIYLIHTIIANTMAAVYNKLREDLIIQTLSENG
jgi:Na+-transporting methylmalonyl-CoA/oxaloacetate decarboxylase gamma subunit